MPLLRTASLIFSTGNLSPQNRAAVGHHFVDRQRFFSTDDLIGADARRRMLRREQLTAVLIRNVRDRQGADSRGFRRNLILVHSHQRPQHFHCRRLSNRREILERLRRHLADDFAGHERARAPLTGKAFRDPKHQTAIEDDTELGWDGEEDLLLKLPEGNEHETRLELMPRQQRRDLADLLLRCAGKDRVAVKVDQHHGTAPPHHPICRDGRVDPSRKQTCEPSPGATRQAACPGLFAEKIESLIRQHLDVNREGRFIEVHPPSSGLLDEPRTTSRSICGEVNGKRLSDGAR